MNRTKRLGRLGGLVVSAAAAVPFVYLWVQMMINADDPLTLRIRLDMAIWIAVFGTPWMVAALALAGVAGCVGCTTWYVAEYPLTPSGHPPVISATLTPVTAVVLAVVLAAGLWLAVAPPRWLAGDRLGRRFGVAIALVVVAGFVLVSRLGWHGVDGPDAGMMSYLLLVPPLTFVAGSATAAATGRSFRTGLTACAWATVPGGLLVVVAWLAEAPHWYRQLGGLLLDADGGVGMGANLGDAIWWTLVVLVLWTLPIGVLGAAAGSARARRRRAREHAGLASAP